MDNCLICPNCKYTIAITTFPPQQLINNTGSEQRAIGYDIAIGANANYMRTISGNDSVAVGYPRVTATQNTAISSHAITTSGNDSVAVSAGYMRTISGNDSVAIGYPCVTATQNIAAGYNNYINSTGTQNMLIGANAGSVILTGSSSKIIGWNSI